MDQRLVRRRFNVAVGSSPVAFEGLPVGDMLLAGVGDEELSVLMMLWLWLWFRFGVSSMMLILPGMIAGGWIDLEWSCSVLCGEMMRRKVNVMKRMGRTRDGQDLMSMMFKHRRRRRRNVHKYGYGGFS